ncbi:MAG TPA: 23S rRNA (pseudouridine(1915)-N(3))-methyltransferase RlmH [Bacilli bacterium]|jgi:23S rRNA (pseudouridine1915-N3)-methyltransferase|nr:23S rRNA (pseudouridine(1915)-N(3))-methyltransferase RlmH [Acholeplasmataceae bacterium]HNZ77806.1 23S rRNA (pseudouridine(1915)-N(3))-methyltransferase RlmH [Bacilli bacterium]HOD60925.1 23S rRNA (pseudouridine(1915)-N(3))-methyltransferase RlmH [Bacilli bacterium]HOH61087.1 23S rRNA (pseudouridine(1915)-N(3))-methyltransferase RlmH [Bacilli bacterium]HPB48699.1 23S rRNA (pseudouridine(1915)-N(3))-methyltransferase RlmH [Bacilli bacterium]
MDINVIVVGKIKENYLLEGIEEYKKRIKPFCNLQIIEIKEITTADSHKNLKEEAKAILNNIKKEDYVITLEILGNSLDSVELAKFIQNHYLYSSRVLTFVIGSSDGLDEEVKKRSDYQLSFSKLTFPHQLMRMLFLEQIYRSLTIINNQKYHK